MLLFAGEILLPFQLSCEPTPPSATTDALMDSVARVSKHIIGTNHQHPLPLTPPPLVPSVQSVLASQSHRGRGNNLNLSRQVLTPLFSLFSLILNFLLQAKFLIINFTLALQTSTMSSICFNRRAVMKRRRSVVELPLCLSLVISSLAKERRITIRSSEGTALIHLHPLSMIMTLKWHNLHNNESRFKI
jgi:hypothetical protein